MPYLDIIIEYLDIIFVTIIMPCFGDCFKPVHCDSPEEIWKEFAFYHVDSKVMVEECRTSTHRKSKEDLSEDFKAHRAKFTSYTPTFMQPKHSNQSTIQQSELHKRQPYKDKKKSF